MNIVKIFLSQAVPGMVVAADVYTKYNHLILPVGATLNDKAITRMEFYSIIDLSIFAFTSPIDHDGLLEKETYYGKVKKSESFHSFHLAYQNTLTDFETSLNDFVFNQKPIEVDKLLADTGKIISQCNSNTELFNMLHCIRNYDDATYVHCLNVALISNIIGRWLRFIPEDLETITLSGLLHDLGKLMIPSDIILKPAKLTQEEFSTIKTHTIRGYSLLMSQNIDSRIKHSALMHHERCDGSGYPNGYFRDQIDPFARLVAIADVYDAMTCARVYRGPLCPFEVLSIFETEGYSKYDPKYIMTFMESIAQTYINVNVKLNNDMIGEVIFINKSALSRPVVKVDNQFIDLSKQRNLTIVSLI